MTLRYTQRSLTFVTLCRNSDGSRRAPYAGGLGVFPAGLLGGIEQCGILNQVKRVSDAIRIDFAGRLHVRERESDQATCRVRVLPRSEQIGCPPGEGLRFVDLARRHTCLREECLGRGDLRRGRARVRTPEGDEFPEIVHCRAGVARHQMQLRAFAEKRATQCGQMRRLYGQRRTGIIEETDLRRAAASLIRYCEAAGEPPASRCEMPSRISSMASTD